MADKVREIVYFEKAGRENTDKVIQLVAKRLDTRAGPPDTPAGDDRGGVPPETRRGLQRDDASNGPGYLAFAFMVHIHNTARSCPLGRCKQSRILYLR